VSFSLPDNWCGIGISLRPRPRQRPREQSQTASQGPAPTQRGRATHHTQSRGRAGGPQRKKSQPTRYREGCQNPFPASNRLWTGNDWWSCSLVLNHFMRFRAVQGLEGSVSCGALPHTPFLSPEHALPPTSTAHPTAVMHPLLSQPSKLQYPYFLRTLEWIGMST
jgi:hypothetical protein